jgi:pilus assembly protein CpaB
MARPARSWLLLFFALATGTVAAWLALRYLREQTRPLLSSQPSQARAVVAVRDLPVGARVTERDVKSVSWPGDALPPGLISQPGSVIGRGLIASVRLNEPFLESKLAPITPGPNAGLPILITEGERALTVRVDEVVGVAGFVVPGTRVDVLLTTSEGSPTNEMTTRAIMQNIETLAAGQSIQVDVEGKPQEVPVVTLLVTPEQAETLALAATQGRIQLTLRNMLDTLHVRTPGARITTLLTGGRPGVLARGTSFRRPVQAGSSEETAIVEGFRGGERTVTRFSRGRINQEGVRP